MSFAPEILKFPGGRIENLAGLSEPEKAALRKEHEAERCKADPAHRAALDRRAAAKARPTAAGAAVKPASGKPPATA